MAGENNPLSYAFWAGTPSNSPLSYDALQTRRKIAEQLMGKRSPFPKTFGEGLTYAGERFADVMDMNRLDAAEKQQAAYEANVLRGGPPLPGAENTAVAPAAPPTARPTASVPAGNLPVGNSAPLEAGTPGPLERASPEEGGYNFLDAQALAGGRGPRFRTERNAEVGSRVGFDKAIQGINPEMQARMLAAYEAMPDNIKQTFAYNEGSRPRDYQQYLYDTRSGRGPVAPPGTSRHEAGQAIDVDRGAALDWLKANGAQFGLESIRGDYPHLQMARSGAAFGNPNNPATLPIPGQSAVPPMPPGSRDAMASAIVNPSPPGSMVNTPAPLSGGTATPDMLSPGGFTQPSGPVRTASLTPSGVASDAGPQAALPPQTPLDPANNPPIVTPEIKPMPVAQAAPGTIPPSQAGVALPTPPKPRDPGPQPTMPPPTPTMNWLDSIARNRGLSPETRADAQSKYNNLLKVQHDVFINDLKSHKEDVRKFNDPATAIALTKAAYDAEAEKRKLEGEGFFELSPEEKARMGPDIPGVKLYKDRYGNLQKIVGPQTVSIDMAGEKAEAQGIGKHTAERHGKMMEAANTASNSLYTIHRAEALLNRIDTHALAPTELTVGAFGRSLGISDQALAALNLKPEQIGSRQAFNAIVGDLVIGRIGAGGFPANNFSNPDREFLLGTVARLGDDPESNRIKLGALKLSAERDVERAKEWNTFRNAPENKGKSFADFEHHWNAKIDNLHITGELKKQTEALIANSANVPPEAINMLRANPGTADKFDKVFGPGASKRYLGQ